MKQKTHRDLSAFTLVEVIVLIVIIGLLALVFLPKLANRNYQGPIPWDCVNNLKEIGTAYRLWAGDNGDLVPAQQAVAKGGWADLLTNANQGAICWTNYVIMANELGQAPKLLICRYEERTAADAFTNKLDNSNLSYFVGVSANDLQPQSIAGGDRNLGPGLFPTNDYGYSPKNGKGNDVAIPTNSSKGPVSWSLKIHSRGNASGAGNILFGDGSVLQVSTASFNQQWLPNANPTTNWPAGHVPANPSIRLVFP
jgi:prepilin-type processing-associated H-X9-DG protein